MKVFDAVKKGFGVATKNLNLVLVVFIFNLIWNLGVIPFTPEAPAGEALGATMTPMLTVLSIIFILASIFVQGGVLGTVRDIIKEGKAVLGKFAGYGARYYIKLLCVALIIILIIGIIGFVATLIIAAAAPTKNTVLVTVATIVTVLLVLAGIWIMLHIFLTPYILVMDDVGVFQAIRNSADFAKKSLLKILGLALTLVLIGFGIGLIMGIVAGLLSLVVKGKIFQVVTGVINGGVNAYITVLVAAALAAYYLASKGAKASE